jgi:hypothetical protein
MAVPPAETPWYPKSQRRRVLRLAMSSHAAFIIAGIVHKKTILRSVILGRIVSKPRL